MKTISICFAITNLSFILVSCSKNNNELNEMRQQSNIQFPIELAAPLANAFTDFSFYFFNNLQTEQKTNDNIFVSPLSLHIALGMLANGADKETKSEIMKALKSDHLSQIELNDAYKTLLTALPKADPLVKMALANAIFYKNSIPFENSFLNIIKNNFNAQITGLPFVPADLVTINKWASDNTQGKIPKVLNELNPDLVMLLMNALYFKGDWRSKFDKTNTINQVFNLESGGQKKVKMMNLKDTFKFTTQNNFSALQLPYGNGQFVATLLLPKEGVSISSVYNELNEEKWMALQSKLSHAQEVEVGLPKFKLEQEFDLKPTLQKMGIVSAFSSNAQFGAISQLPLKVSFVKQNTFASVDEEGTEAAAVTIIGIELTSATPKTPKFICDRPFGIIISEKTSNTILFMGRIMNPSE